MQRFHIIYYPDATSIYCSGVTVEAKDIIHAMSIFNYHHYRHGMVIIGCHNVSLTLKH